MRERERERERELGMCERKEQMRVRCGGNMLERKGNRREDVRI